MNRHSGIRYQLIFSIMLAVYTAVLAYFAYPIAKVNLSSADIQEHYQTYTSENATKEYQSYKIYLCSISGYEEIEREIEVLGRDALHLALEALSMGPTDEELGNGIISYIPKDTEFIGVSEVNGSVFAEFSAGILSSRNPSLAYTQIEKTIRECFECKEVFIISEGAIINR